MSLLLPQRSSESQQVTAYALWCPACKHAHVLRIVGESPVWSFDGNMTAPDFRPSQVVRTGAHTCHFNVARGILQFLPDCTHELAGKTIPMVDWDTINQASSAT